MTHTEADQYEKGSFENLLGYTSTSKRFKTALDFALYDL